MLVSIPLFSQQLYESKENGFVMRDRMIDAALMFWSLAFGFGIQLQRTLASPRRLYEEKSEVHISRSSFYDRFTPELVNFLHACVSVFHQNN
jgi:putative transposase